MILRLSLFVILLASFYYYCQDNSSPSQLNRPNDMNMIEIPKDFEPESRNDLFLKAGINTDSTKFIYTQNFEFRKSQIELASTLR